LKLVSGAGAGNDDTITLRYAFQGLPSGYFIGRPNQEGKAEKEEYTFSASWNDGLPQFDGEAFVYTMRLMATCSGEDWPYASEDGKLPPGLTLALQQQGRTVFTVKSGGFPVDKAELALVNKNLLKLQKGGKETTYWEVPDPRMNHLTDLWVVGDGSMGKRNDTAKQAVQRNVGVSDPQSGDFAMFCRNGPMETPGDLGFIPTSGASGKIADTWKTLDLYSLDAAWLMRQLASREELYYVRIDPISGRRLSFPDSLPICTNGTINPNTPLTNVLQAAFCDLIAEGIPGWNNTMQNKKLLTASEAREIASRIIGYRSKGKYDTKESLGQEYDFASGSDWVTAFADSTWHKELEDLFDRPKNVREGLIRQTWGLFRPEDNLFVMVVIGQGIREGPTGTLGAFNEADDEIVGEKREVLLVWRDPFPVDGNREFDMQIISRTELGD
jgi:hypothetical protein